MRQVLEVLRETHSRLRLDVHGRICVYIHCIDRMQGERLTIYDARVLVSIQSLHWKDSFRADQSLLQEYWDPYDDRPYTHHLQILVRHPVLREGDGPPLLLTVLHVERCLLHNEHDQVLHDSHFTFHRYRRSHKILTNLRLYSLQLLRMHNSPTDI